MPTDDDDNDNDDDDADAHTDIGVHACIHVCRVIVAKCRCPRPPGAPH